MRPKNYTETKKGHVDARLTDVSIQYKQGDFVSDMVFPEMPVVKGADEITVYHKANLFQTPDDHVAKSAEARRVLMSSSTSPYSVIDRALKGEVTETDYLNADNPLDPEIDETEVVTASILLNREIRAHAVAMAITNTGSPSTKWTASAGDPVSDIEDAISDMFARPNTIIFSYPVWQQFKYNTNVIAKIGGGFTGLKMATEEMVKGLFGVDFVRVANSRKGANKVPATGASTLSYVWGKDVMLCYTDPRNARKMATFGRLYAQKFDGGQTFRVRKFRDENAGVGGTTVIQVEHRSVEKVIAEDFGYSLTDCIA